MDCEITSAVSSPTVHHRHTVLRAGAPIVSSPLQTGMTTRRAVNGLEDIIFIFLFCSHCKFPPTVDSVPARQSAPLTTFYFLSDTIGMNTSPYPFPYPHHAKLLHVPEFRVSQTQYPSPENTCAPSPA